ncbi:MAG: glutathione S-transferase [Gammaproteobacteria bacterium]|nr:MAG: glutathione S-transferase [Gammaproteobacteria bacterium]
MSINEKQFPVLKQYPCQHPERLQLYSFPTPNGVKVSIMLEEIGLPYEAHRVNIMANETWQDAFLSLNPNGKIPAIIDPDGPNGKPLALFESGAILLYLAEKSGQLLAADPVKRIQTLQWVFFQMGGVGPIFGQLGYFYRFAGKAIEDKRPLQRFAAESKRLLGVLDNHLAEREWMVDDFSIADISLLGWVRALHSGYQAQTLLELETFSHVNRWLAAGLDRPAVQRGLSVPV